MTTIGPDRLAAALAGRDRKHGRDVAIKALPPDLGAALGGDAPPAARSHVRRPRRDYASA